MPLRVLPFSPRKEKPPAEPAPAEPARSFWRTSLLLLTSAACGGIAVAIWNRRSLTLMRQSSEAVGQPAPDPHQAPHKDPHQAPQSLEE